MLGRLKCSGQAKQSYICHRQSTIPLKVLIKELLQLRSQGSQKRASPNTQGHTHTQARTHKYTHTYTHTHTHTHTDKK